MARIIILLGIFLLSCTQKPSPPKNQEKMEQLALNIFEEVEPGFLFRKEVNGSELWDEMQEMEIYGAEVQPDTSSVVLRMIGFPRNYIYFYRIREADEEWLDKVRRLKLQEVADKWYWRGCNWGISHSSYPC